MGPSTSGRASPNCRRGKINTLMRRSGLMGSDATNQFVERAAFSRTFRASTFSHLVRGQ
jgi:alanine racemase